MTLDNPNGSAWRYPSGQVLRETALYRATSEDRIGLDCFGEVLRRYLLEYNAGGQTAGKALRAADKDLRHLEGYFREIADAMAGGDLPGSSGKSRKELARIAARKLGR